MIFCAVSVVDANWKQWLEAIGDMRVVRGLECSASFLVSTPDFQAAAKRDNLRISHARDLLPADMARYLTESPALGRGDVLDCLKKTLAQCQACGVESVCLQMGLDRIGDATFDHDMNERVRLLRALMPAADRHKLTVCLRVRHPRAFPGSKEWERAAHLVHEVMHPCCRLALDFFPAEVPPDHDLEELIRSCCFHVGVVRFHYTPSLGETLDAASQARWAKLLQQHGYKGAVVFCPNVTEEDGIATACEKIDQWAEAYA